jgi:lysophospholipase L1-like esterase
VLLLPVLLALSAPQEFELRDGDRVVWIGSTVVEREQQFGYWEAALTRHYPERNITFRNLGWSGDTVWGESRASFDPPEVGYKRLIEHTRSLKPTVIFVGYGTNESFAGESGLPRFRKQLNKLLDDLSPSKPRFVPVAPPMFEEVSWKGGDLKQARANLALYRQAIKEIAAERGAWFVDDVAQKYSPSQPLMDNGMHLTAFGYWWTAGNLLTELHLPVRGLRLVELDTHRIEAIESTLPVAPAPGGTHDGTVQADSLVLARGLEAGKYALKIDGQQVQTEDAKTWMYPPMFGRVFVRRGPSLDQSEKLRQAIVEKNQLYFHRWRPQNETYLFGFRKYEQGQNAREIPQFDPLIAKVEQEIARLRRPVIHTYELVPVKP